MTAALYHKKLERALKQGGDLYSLNDILDAIAEAMSQGTTFSAPTEIEVRFAEAIRETRNGHE